VAGHFRFTPQTRSVLAAFAADPADWLHGYLLAKQTGLRSGTLYPILIRLADRRLIEARWEDEQPAGRPRRHMYRLTTEGLAAARTALPETTPDAGPDATPKRRRPAAARQRGRKRLAAEGGA
jgi:PadR family transcriptional regulator, regulatory protein PadR